jgi:hypothetical protein
MPSSIRKFARRIEAARQERRLIGLTRAAVAGVAGPREHRVPPVFSVRLDPAIAHGFDAVIRRDGTGFEISLSRQCPAETVKHGPSRIRAYAYWMLASSDEVERMSITLSDGDRSSAATFSPSSFRSDVVALPDPIFFSAGGYVAERTAGLTLAVPWRQRSTTLLWRGGMNSQQSFDPDIAVTRPELASQRLVACLALRGVPDTDVKFAIAGQSETGSVVYERLGITGPRLPPTTWLASRYALDIDGYSNAWSNLFTRLLFGCCVLKIDSRYGFRQWYYDRLKPWEHYVPVAADLSNLVERLDWARSHDGECREIAQRGRSLAVALTMSAATREAAALIEANWRRQR